MNDKETLKATLRKFFKRMLKKSTAFSGMVSPERDWKILLLAFVVLNIISAAFGAFLFLQINKGDIFLVEQAQPSKIKTIDRVLLNDTVGFFEEKERAYEELKKRRPRVADPSL